MEEEFLEIDKKNGWNTIFQDIRNRSSNYSYVTSEAKKHENKNLNRYRDVNPFDHSRVCLRRSEKDYINASFVSVPSAKRSYILTQGPLPGTTGHFWLMIWEQKSKAILMLNKVIEKNTVKCHQYWPIGSENGGSDDLVLTNVSLKVTFLSQSAESYYVKRKFLLTDFESNDSREVLQFHYTTWPDFGVPQSPGAFLDFLFSVRDSGVLNNVGLPIVHCSAGIGRSGTFCLVDSCLVLIEKTRHPNSVNIQKQLLEMRHFRMGLIQTPDQLRFSYLAIIEGAKRVLTNILKDNFIENENETQTSNNYILNSNNANIGENEAFPNFSTLDSNFCHTSNDFTSSPKLISSTSISDRIEVTLNKTKMNKKAISEEKNSSTSEKQGAANFSKKRDISENGELRKRSRKEREEKTANLVQNIKKKQKESEIWDKRRSFIKVSFGLVLIVGMGYYIYKKYS